MEFFSRYIKHLFLGFIVSNIWSGIFYLFGNNFYADVSNLDIHIIGKLTIYIVICIMAYILLLTFISIKIIISEIVKNKILRANPAILSIPMAYGKLSTVKKVFLRTFVFTDIRNNQLLIEGSSKYRLINKEILRKSLYLTSFISITALLSVILLIINYSSFFAFLILIWFIFELLISDYILLFTGWFISIIKREIFSNSRVGTNISSPMNIAERRSRLVELRKKVRLIELMSGKKYQLRSSTDALKEFEALSNERDAIISKMEKNDYKKNSHLSNLELKKKTTSKIKNKT